MMQAGNLMFSSALLDDSGDETVGSLRVMSFETRAELDEWLEKEPYVTGSVWQTINVSRCRIAPAFEWMTLEPGEIRLNEGPSQAD